MPVLPERMVKTDRLSATMPTLQTQALFHLWRLRHSLPQLETDAGMSRIPQVNYARM